MKRYLLLLINAVFLFSPAVFSQHSGPENQSACLGDTALFLVEHSFDFVSFTWQESNDGVTNFRTITDTEGYGGIQSDALNVFTGALNPPTSGIWRYYRCKMFSTFYDTVYSNTAFLNINFPPASVDFTWTNPCESQSVHFSSVVSAEATPAAYLWTFGDAAGGTSVYPDPSYIFNYYKDTTFQVTLFVQDVNGCGKSVTKDVEIFKIPDITIEGKEVVCSNENAVIYKAVMGANSFDTIRYDWEISGIGPIGPDSPEISIDWFAVDVPTQNDIFLTVTFYTSTSLYCSTKVSKNVLITTYKAPPQGEVFRKPVNSSVLIYKGPEVKSYRWGFTDAEGDHYFQDHNGGVRLYCDFGTLKLENETYWVETSYDSRINCITRSYFDNVKNEQFWDEKTETFQIYPVPASNHLTIKSDNYNIVSDVVIYNFMMQEVFAVKDKEFSPEGCTISLEGIKSGVYIIQITDESGINQFRVFNIEK
jgi:hypothetical protein